MLGKILTRYQAIIKIVERERAYEYTSCLLGSRKVTYVIEAVVVHRHRATVQVAVSVHRHPTLHYAYILFSPLLFKCKHQMLKGLSSEK